jgi:hypothetical protein
MNPFIFLTKWFWVVFIAGTFINAVVIRARARPRIIANPELRDGYRTITSGLLTCRAFYVSSPMAHAKKNRASASHLINALSVHVEFGRFDFSGYPDLDAWPDNRSHLATDEKLAYKLPAMKFWR